LRVKAVAMENGSYNERKQYLVTKDGAITVSGGEDKPPQAAAPAVQQQQPAAKPNGPWTTSIDERIAWNSAINNACTAIGQADVYLERPSTEGGEFLVHENYGSRVINIASLLYGLIRQGPPPEEEPEEQAEPALSEDDILGKL
jgi:hypothetical protein